MQLVNEKNAAQILGCTVSALRRWRREMRGPQWVRLGRLIRYQDRALEAFVAAHTEGTPVGPALARIPTSRN
jgi:predicted DNA-binding transcriptional regulator AlpA